MKIFKAVVIRINDIPSENGAFSQKEIIVSPYSSDRETASEYIAIPPSIFPTDTFGSGVITLPELNQHCIVAETDGFRRVQILSYVPFAATTTFGEYTPVDISSGGAAFKIGGTKPLTMYFHKGGKWELYSNEFCNLSLDGTKRKLDWTVDSEHRVFAGGRIDNTYEEIEGTEKSTRHVEIYTQTFEWKQNSDLRISTEKSVLNPETTIIPLPDYSYVPKVIIKAGMITNQFDSNLGKILGHVYQLETRQSTYTGDKDTVSVLKLGRQSEMYKFDNDRVYPAGDMLEWSSKTAQITSEASHVSTHLLRFGELEKDVISNGVPVEYIQGEVYRNQSHINIVEPIGAPLIDQLAAGKGYEFEWYKTAAAQQYLVSYGQLNSDQLTGNADFLYKSAVREHFHAFDNHSAATIASPTGMRRDFVNFFDDNGEKGLYFEKFSKIAAGIEEIFQKEIFTDQKYEFEQKMPTRRAYRLFNAQKYEKTVHLDPELDLEEKIEANLFKNYVKLDNSTEKTEEFNSQLHKMEIKLGGNTFLVNFDSSGVKISLDTGSVPNNPYIKMSNAGFEFNPGQGNQDSDNIVIGGDAGPQYLVTKSFIDLIFTNHIHPTAGPGAPTLPPTPITVPQVIDSPANTYTMQIKGE